MEAAAGAVEDDVGAPGDLEGEEGDEAEAGDRAEAPEADEEGGGDGDRDREEGLEVALVEVGGRPDQEGEVEEGEAQPDPAGAAEEEEGGGEEGEEGADRRGALGDRAVRLEGEGEGEAEGAAELVDGCPMGQVRVVGVGVLEEEDRALVVGVGGGEPALLERVERVAVEEGVLEVVGGGDGGTTSEETTSEETTSEETSGGSSGTTGAIEPPPGGVFLWTGAGGGGPGTDLYVDEVEALLEGAGVEVAVGATLPGDFAARFGTLVYMNPTGDFPAEVDAAAAALVEGGGRVVVVMEHCKNGCWGNADGHNALLAALGAGMRVAGDGGAGLQQTELPVVAAPPLTDGVAALVVFYSGRVIAGPATVALGQIPGGDVVVGWEAVGSGEVVAVTDSSIFGYVLGAGDNARFVTNLGLH